MMGKGKELELPEGPGGLESASRILMKGSGIREADSDDRGFPLRNRMQLSTNHICQYIKLCKINGKIRIDKKEVISQIVFQIQE